jgi:hypothetical protein
MMDNTGIPDRWRKLTFDAKEMIVLRAFLSGTSDSLIRKNLKMTKETMILLLREIQEKTDTDSLASLLDWARPRITTGERRMGR